MMSRNQCCLKLALVLLAAVAISLVQADDDLIGTEGYRRGAQSDACLPIPETYDTYEKEDPESGRNITESVEQEITGSDEEIAATEEVIKRTMKYIQEELPKPQYDKVRSICMNKDKSCSFWASEGECESSPAYMKVDCALACQSCDILDAQIRCKKDPNAVDIWQPGDLNKVFSRIAYGPGSETLKVQVLSSPFLENKTGKEGSGPLPWVLVIDDFISESECQRLLEYGAQEGFTRSKEVGGELPDGTYENVISPKLTSTQYWCDNLCIQDDIIKGISKKIENLTGIPESHSGNFQLLKYDEGQFFNTHHDFLPHLVDRPCGPRIATAFLYLNDVEAGGGTNFPELNITIMPKVGRLLLWPHVLNHDLWTPDQWTLHQGLPVEKGVKIGASRMLHLRNYKIARETRCY